MHVEIECNQYIIYIYSNHPLVCRSVEKVLASIHSVRSFSQIQGFDPNDFNWILLLDTHSIERWLEIAVRCGIQQRQPVILLANDRQSQEEVMRLVYLGVRGIVPVTNLETDLSPAIDAVIKGRLWIDRGTLDEYVIRTSMSGVFRGSKFTMREDQIITMLVNRLSNKEIASVLGISDRTVKFHVSNILKKFKIKNRRDLLKNPSAIRSATQPAPAEKHRTSGK
jgi:DNA-binding NarL/FixJ family response regulator